MRVRLLKHTPEPDRLVALAARRCYSSMPADAIDQQMGDAEVDRLLGVLRLRNHLSPFEHASFTFSVDGVSRALSHQLVRHRIASYSQESQRYVEYPKLDQLPYVVPPSVLAKPEAVTRFRSAADQALAAYRDLLALGVPPEDARYVFPNAIETKLIFTLNARSLFGFFEQRCCRKAQWEIRSLAQQMLKICRAAAPRVFQTAGAPCGYDRPFCRENDPSCAQFSPVSLPGTSSHSNVRSRP